MNMSLYTMITKEHWSRLPTIRIQKIVLKHFKNVNYGEIIFDCGKRFVPFGTKSDILGIYGQNGSGKTSLIEALSILKYAMMGAPIPAIYSSCISINEKCAELEFTFDLQYDDNRIRKVEYSFCLGLVNPEDRFRNVLIHNIAESYDFLLDNKLSVCIYNECISMGGSFNTEKVKIQPILDTSPSDNKNPFVPASKRKLFISNDTYENLVDYSYYKRDAYKNSKSFIFYADTMHRFMEEGVNSEYFEVLKELKLFASHYLYVVDTKYIGSISSNIVLPLYNSNTGNVSGKYFFEMINSSEDDDALSQEDEEVLNKLLSTYGVPNILPMAGSFIIHVEKYHLINKQFDSINTVLEQLVPGLNIHLKVLSDATTKYGKPGKNVELVSLRDGIEMPLRYESDGIKKIISILDLIIRAYNQRSTTIAIDEFDSGIYEYLLGEILELFQENGLGQFIFTSHNLRPLEVIDKRFLYFTTTNPDNRYIKFKNVGKTNNLRNLYYREIILGEQDEELYRETKHYNIAAAMCKAGVQDV